MPACPSQTRGEFDLLSPSRSGESGARQCAGHAGQCATDDAEHEAHVQRGGGVRRPKGTKERPLSYLSDGGHHRKVRKKVLATCCPRRPVLDVLQDVLSSTSYRRGTKFLRRAVLDVLQDVEDNSPKVPFSQLQDVDFQRTSWIAATFPRRPLEIDVQSRRTFVASCQLSLRMRTKIDSSQKDPHTPLLNAKWSFLGGGSQNHPVATPAGRHRP